MCCNLTVCFKIRVMRCKICFNHMNSQPLPNLKTQFSQKEDAGSYDNTALNQRYDPEYKTIQI